MTYQKLKGKFSGSYYNFKCFTLEDFNDSGIKVLTGDRHYLFFLVLFTGVELDLGTEENLTVLVLGSAINTEGIKDAIAKFGAPTHVFVPENNGYHESQGVNAELIVQLKPQSLVFNAANMGLHFVRK